MSTADERKSQSAMSHTMVTYTVKPGREHEPDRLKPPFRRRAMRLGSRAGAAELGVTLYEIDPGGAVSPYHAHHANEELLLVLDGRPQLRTPDGPPARVLVFSTMNLPRGGRVPRYRDAARQDGFRRRQDLRGGD